jgi:ketosteroid isomerase-like protein
MTMNTRAGVLAIALALSTGVAHAADAPAAKLPAGLELLRRSERAFAKATSEIGIRNGFLMFFAPDAISPPDSGSARTRLLGRPAPVEPRPTDLAWEPLYGDIAQSADIGYLTGPSSFSTPDGAKHTGVYFSVWRKSAGGLWQVVFDAGVDTPSPAPEFADGVFHAAPQPEKPVATVAAATAQSDLRQTEIEFATMARGDAEKAYGRYLGAAARLHRDGMHPLLGRDAILAKIGTLPGVTSANLEKVDVASTGDLGWTYSRITTPKDGNNVSGGAMRVWRRDADGQWRIVVDILNPARE